MRRDPFLFALPGILGLAVGVLLGFMAREGASHEAQIDAFVAGAGAAAVAFDRCGPPSEAENWRLCAVGVSTEAWTEFMRKDD